MNTYKASKINQSYIDGKDRFQLVVEETAEEALHSHTIATKDITAARTMKVTREVGMVTLDDLMEEKKEHEQKLAEVQKKIDAINVIQKTR
jgi:hypothetical protein